MIGHAEPSYVRIFGPGPTGATCQDCIWALGIQYGGEPLWFCKRLRDYAAAGSEPISDCIRPEWRACGGFEARDAA